MQLALKQFKQKDCNCQGERKTKQKASFSRVAQHNKLWSGIATGAESHTANTDQNNHHLEQQADSVAQAVVNGHTVRTDSSSSSRLQLKSASTSSVSSVGAASSAIVNQANSRGIALPADSQQYFGNRMRHDFSSVKIYTDENAANSAESMNARAYTLGNHIVFNRGEYQPDNIEGRKLLAHELTHVVQQNNGQGSGTIQKQDKAGQKQQPTLFNVPVGGIHLKSLPNASADNFPGDKVINGDVVVINNSGGAGTYNNVKNGSWAWIEVPGKSSPDPKYPTLHGFIETQYISQPKKEEAKVEPKEKAKVDPDEKPEEKEVGPYNDCADSPTNEKYRVIGKGDSSDKYQDEIDRLNAAKETCPGWKVSIEQQIRSLTTYKAERGNSTLADCPLTLVFNGMSLDCGSGGTFLAVSGEQKTDTVGKYFDYSNNAQEKTGGPIPEGIYWLNPAELSSLRFRPDIGAIPWGTHRITIHPFETTATFGRGGFFIHGGTIPGSIGCIDVTNNVDKVADAIDDHSDCKIKLVVKYKSKRIPA